MVTGNVSIGYFEEWGYEFNSLPAGTMTKKEKSAMKLSKESVGGLRITSKTVL